MLPKIYSIIMLLWGCVAYSATLDHYSFKLKDMYGADISASEVKAVIPFRIDANKINAMYQEIRVNNLNVADLGEEWGYGLDFNENLHLSFSYLGNENKPLNVVAMACREGKKNCERLPFQFHNEKDNKIRFQLEINGKVLDIFSSGKICRQGQSCHINLPNWFLASVAKQRSFHAHSLSHSGVALVLDQKIVFADAMQGKPWFEFKNQDILSKLGMLTKFIPAKSESVLIGQFDKGIAIFDFLRNQIVTIDAEGIVRHPSAFLSKTSHYQAPLFIREKSQIPVVYADDEGMVVWADVAMKFTDFLEIKDYLYEEVSLSFGAVVEGWMLDQKGLVLQAKEGERKCFFNILYHSGQILPSDKECAKEEEQSLLMSINSQMFLGQKGGVFLLKKEVGDTYSQTPTSIELKDSNYYYLGFGEFIIAGPKNSVCEWTHLRQHVTSSSSFSGIPTKIPCGQKVHTFNGNNVSIITSLSHDIIKTSFVSK